jgi:uncharacterized protein YciI
MKLIISLGVLLLCSCLATAQDTKADSLYIVTYTTSTAWDASKPPAQQIGFKEHSARLSELRKAGPIKFGARYAEKGMIVIAAVNLQAAKEIINADPAVVNKLFNADVQKLRVFYDWVK